MSLRVGVVVFPGSNCEQDMLEAMRLVGGEPELLWHGDAETLAQLRDEDRIVLRYVVNPNGSVDNIAGVCNEGRNVVGLMPHPERSTSELLGSTDGLPLLRSLLSV